MIQLFLDTEFCGKPERQTLLSIGLVGNDGQELYMELPPAEVSKLPRKAVNDFVRAEVLPQFCLVPHACVPRADMPNRLVSWLNGLAAKVEVVYDFSGDFALLEQLLADATVRLAPVILPCHVGYSNEDPVGQEAEQATWAQVMSERGVRRHHALADAYALRGRFLAIHGPT